MKIICISDTHSYPLSKLDLPEGDLLIHAGDATSRGSEGEVNDFNRELGLIRDKYKHGIVFTPGNHDFYFEKKARYTDVKKIITHAKCLLHESIELAGMKIFGSPYTPEFCNWAFNVPRNGPRIIKLWAEIPSETDILITHGPPKHILDLVLHDMFNAGCEALMKAVQRVNPKLHVFGHIHCAAGEVTQADTVFVNACIMDEAYKPVQNPVIVEI